MERLARPAESIAMPSAAAAQGADGPSPAYREGEDYRFAGWQPRGSGRDPMRLVTDLLTESTFGLLPGEVVGEKVAEHRRDWQRKQRESAERARITVIGGDEER